MITLTRRRLIAAGCAVLASACAPATRTPGDGPHRLYAHPARDEWPEELRRLPAEIQDMYRYAANNEAVLKWMPCTCGCVSGGHESNYACYVRAVLPDGRIELDTMSFG